MNVKQKSLLTRILGSQHFAKAPALKSILQYICEKTADTRSTPVKEYDIAIEALDRRENFDSKIDPIVRVNIANIRERLGRYFSREGLQEELRLIIPKGEYRAVFYESGPLSTLALGEEVQKQNLEKFWQPYLIGSVRNALLFTELLFLRDGAGNLVRNIYCNDQATVHRDLARVISDSELAGYFPSYHYVSSGEMLCSFHLSGMFASLGVHIQPSNARFESWHSLSETNLILIGGSRTNLFLDALQGRQNFVIAKDRILNLEPTGTEPEFYQGKRIIESKIEKLTEYVLVTRRPGLNQGCFFTTIASNHGRAIEAAGQFLTDEAHISHLFKKLGLGINGDEGLPDFFQFLLQVEMLDQVEEIIKVEYLTHRVLSR